MTETTKTLHFYLQQTRQTCSRESFGYFRFTGALTVSQDNISSHNNDNTTTTDQQRQKSRVYAVEYFSNNRPNRFFTSCSLTS